jgi:hypothetical protein
LCTFGKQRAHGLDVRPSHGATQSTTADVFKVIWVYTFACTVAYTFAFTFGSKIAHKPNEDWECAVRAPVGCFANRHGCAGDFCPQGRKVLVCFRAFCGWASCAQICVVRFLLLFLLLPLFFLLLLFLLLLFCATV